MASICVASRGISKLDTKTDLNQRRNSKKLDTAELRKNIVIYETHKALFRFIISGDCPFKLLFTTSIHRENNEE